MLLFALKTRILITHTHSLIAHVVHISSLLRYPWFPVVCVHVDGPCVIDPDWASQEEIPACH